SLIRHLPRSTLFPYTTLFRSLEFFSIKVPDGALTSRLQNINVGDSIMLTVRPAGTLVPGYLIPGKHLYLLSTGTGLAPFMSIIRSEEPRLNSSHVKISYAVFC